VRKNGIGPLRVHLEEVEAGWRFAWSPGSSSAVWSNRPLAQNLCDVFLRRWLETERGGEEGVSLRSRVFAPLADVIAFLNGDTDDELLADLLWALVGIDWTVRAWFRQPKNRDRLGAAFRVPVTSLSSDFALLRLLAQPIGLATTEDGMHWQARTEALVTTTPAASPFHLLGRARPSRETLDDAIDQVARRLWARGLVPFGWQNRRRRTGKYQAGSPVDLDPRRLVAACLFPLSPSALGRLADRVITVPVQET
jgi:CRISPR-associated protein Csx17